MTEVEFDVCRPAAVRARDVCRNLGVGRGEIVDERILRPAVGSRVLPNRRRGGRGPGRSGRVRPRDEVRVDGREPDQQPDRDGDVCRHRRHEVPQ